MYIEWAKKVLILLNWTNGSDCKGTNQKICFTQVLILLNWTNGSDRYTRNTTKYKITAVLILLNWTNGSDSTN